MKIFVIGDSISAQYGPFLEKYLYGFMEYARKEGQEIALLDLDFPRGANSGDSSMVFAYLKARAQSGGIEADYLLLNCGLHDIKTNPETGAKQVPLDLYEKNLRMIVEQVAKMGLKLVWMRTTPCDERVHNRIKTKFQRYSSDCEVYNEAADKIMKEARIPIIDLYTFSLNLGPDIFRDGVHFHEHNCEKQGAFIAGWLCSHIL